jgi:hypothetical protein
MNKQFINCLYFTAAFFFFSTLTVYGQQFEKHEDNAYVNPNVTGVGTPVIVYHLTAPLETKVLAELKDYMDSFEGITRVDTEGNQITLHFKQATTNEMIYLFIQRMEMLYIYRNSKSQ